MRRAKLDGKLIWLIAIPSSTAFHAIIVFTLTFVLNDGPSRLDDYAQLSPIQFVLLSGEAVSMQAVTESRPTVGGDTEAEPSSTEEVSEETKNQLSSLEEVSEEENIETETMLDDSGVSGITEVTEEGIFDVAKVNSPSLPGKLEVQDEASTKEVQSEVISKGFVQDEDIFSPSRHYTEVINETYRYEYAVSPTIEKSSSDITTTASRAGSQGSYDAITEAYAMFVRNKPPSYPIIARRNGWEGSVMLEAVVSPSGDCVEARVISSSGYQILDRTAIKAVRRWKFVPAMRGDEPIKSTVLVPVVFRLNHQ